MLGKMRKGIKAVRNLVSEDPRVHTVGSGQLAELRSQGLLVPFVLGLSV
jgi:hypothetical protein